MGFKERRSSFNIYGNSVLSSSLACGVLVSIFAQLCPPGGLHRAKNANIEGLHFVSGIWGEAHKLDVILPAGLNDLGRNVAG